MYAVIQTGGKQYRVKAGDVLRVEKLNAEAGAKVKFDNVLLIGEGADIKAGADAAKANVSAVVVSHGLGRKAEIFKKRRRKHSKRTMGHRQPFTEVRIEKITKPRASAKKAAAEDKE